MVCLPLVFLVASCSKGSLQSARALLNEPPPAVAANGEGTTKGMASEKLPSTISIRYPAVLDGHRKEWPELGSGEGTLLLYDGSPGIQAKGVTRYAQQTGAETGQWSEAIAGPELAGATLVVAPARWWTLAPPRVDFIEGRSDSAVFERRSTLDAKVTETARILFGSETQLLLQEQDVLVYVRKNPSTGKFLRFTLPNDSSQEAIAGFLVDLKNDLWVIRAQSVSYYVLNQERNQIEAQTVHLSGDAASSVFPPETTWVARGVYNDKSLNIHHLVSRLGTQLSAAYAAPPQVEPQATTGGTGSNDTNGNPEATEGEQLAAVSYSEEFWNTRMKALAEAHCLPCHGAQAQDRVWTTAHEFAGWAAPERHLDFYIESGSMPKKGSPQEASLSALDRKIMLKFAQEAAAQSPN